MEGDFETQRGLQPYVFRFGQSGETVTATATAELDGQSREIEFRDVAFKDNLLSFVEILEVPDGEIRITFSGKVAGDTITFQRAVGDFGSTEALARKVLPGDSLIGSTSTPDSGSPGNPVNSRGESAGEDRQSVAQTPEQIAATISLKEVFGESFRVGVAANRSIITGQAFRRSADHLASDVALVKHHFNHIVAENDMKWQLVHPRAGADGYDFGPADALVEFAAQNNMELAGHTLVWHSQTPNWVFEGTHLPAEGAESGPGPGRGNGRGFNLNGPRASREELLERMRDHIHTVVGRYKGKVKVWDVVNEAISDSGPDILRRSPWSVIIGPDFIEKAFEYAHEADPEAICGTTTTVWRILRSERSSSR